MRNGALICSANRVKRPAYHLQEALDKNILRSSANAIWSLLSHAAPRRPIHHPL